MKPRRAMQRTALPAVDYAPGHFTAPVRAWASAFGPLWRPSINWAPAGQSQTSTASRERALADGKWWAAGTLGGLSRKSDAELLSQRLLQSVAKGAADGAR